MFSPLLFNSVWMIRLLALLGLLVTQSLVSAESRQIYVNLGDSLGDAVDEAVNLSGQGHDVSIYIGSGIFDVDRVIDPAGFPIRFIGATDYRGRPGSVIRGHGDHRVLQCQSGETGTTLFKNLVIRNGSALGGSSGGGGMVNSHSDPTLVNCAFTNNSAEYGGGMFNLDSNPTVSSCTFTENSASLQGGGMYNYLSGPILTNCVFSSNEADWGGGMYNHYGPSGSGEMVLTDCDFHSNMAVASGGGITNFNSTQKLVNCIIIQNMAGLQGGGIFISSGGGPALDRTSICRNTVNGAQTAGNQVEGGLIDTGSNDFCVNSECDDCDFDGDGWTNEREYVEGTDPYLADSDGDGFDDPLDPRPCDFDNATPEMDVLPGYSINLAIGKAVDGDVIQLRRGTYTEGRPINTAGKAITIRGRLEIGGVATTIQGEQQYQVLQCVNGEGADTRFEYLNIAGGSSSSGGGMVIYSSGPTLQRCSFYGNTATSVGGGISMFYSTAILIDCNFFGNVADDGGGVRISGGTAHFTGCRIEGNRATAGGGGITSRVADLTMVDCEFKKNATAGDGGGFKHETNTGSSSLTRCAFIENEGNKGGGVFIDAGGSADVVDCTFSLNQAFDAGGGMCQSGGGSSLEECYFTSNTASRGGGISCHANASPHLERCIFSLNTANEGGGIYNKESTPTLDRCVIRGNSGDSQGGGIYIVSAGGPILDRTSVCENMVAGVQTIDKQIEGDPINPASNDFCIEVVCGGCDFDADGWTNDQEDVAGTDSFTADSDGDGIDDPQDPKPADADNSTAAFDVLPGFSINLAISFAGDGDLIQLGAGTYWEGEVVDTLGKAVTLRGAPGLDGQGNPVSKIDGRGNHRILQCIGGEAAATRFESLTIQNGSAVQGGGMYNNNSSPTLSGCTITGNTSYGDGGGIFNDVGSGPVILDCRFKDNTAGGSGGGMFDQQCSTRLDNCQFTENVSESDGGGYFTDLGADELKMNACSFTRNYSYYYGAGLHVNAGTATLTQCSFVENESNYYGGGIFNWSGTIELANCVFTGNSSAYWGGGFVNYVNATAVMNNCRFTENTSEYGGGFENYDSQLTAENCVFERNTATDNGGGIESDTNDPSLDLVLIGCTFTANTAIGHGGGLWYRGQSMSVVDCIFQRNEGGISGGGIRVHSSSSGENLTSTVVCENVVGSPGSQVATDGNQVQGQSTVIDATNCIAAVCGGCDFDGDGLSNDVESSLSTDPYDPDSDGDGLDDGQEVNGGTDPNNADSDGDGVVDGADPCPLDVNDGCVGAPAINPVQNPDGTWTYWGGNNMQWGIQEAIDAANPGDTIVVREGNYVDSLVVDTPNLTIRPFVTAGGAWESVNFWNPTQGPEAQNGWAMYLGSDTENTYIGMPRQFRQLPNGFVIPVTVVPGEYSAAAGTAPIELDTVTGECFTFWSRSVDNTGVMSVNGRGTFENCTFTSQLGFGGGAMLVGDANDTSFVDCNFVGLFANGSTLRSDVAGLDLPNYCISIHADAGGTMEPTFSDCVIGGAAAGAENRGESIVYQNGGGGSWTGCDFISNESLVNFSGVVTLMSCNPHFSECDFDNNRSGYGTIFMNGVGVSSLDPVRFSGCEFDGNDTIDGQWGGVIYAEDAKSSYGTAAKVMFDRCTMLNNNGNAAVDPSDFVSPWFPTYRQGGQNEIAFDGSQDPVCTPSADLNGDGVVNGSDMGIMFGAWGTDGNL